MIGMEEQIYILQQERIKTYRKDTIYEIQTNRR